LRLNVKVEETFCLKKDPEGRVSAWQFFGMMLPDYRIDKKNYMFFSRSIHIILYQNRL